MRRDEIQALQEQKTALIQELRDHSAVAQHYQADNNLTEWRAEDTDKYEKLSKEIIGLNATLERERRTELLTQFNPEDHVKIGLDGSPKTFAEFRAASGDVPIQDLPDVRTAVYSWLLKGRDGIGSEEFRVLSKAASGGGFLVPTDMADQIVRALRFLPGGVGALARTLVTTNGDSFQIPLNLTHGTAAWIAESGAYTPSDETITQGTLSAFKAGTKVIVSEELLTDSAFDLSGFLATEFGERIGALAEDAYINGDGSGKPTGLINAAGALASSALPAGQVTTTTWAGVAGAIYALPAQYRANAQFLVSDGFYVRLATLVDSTGRPIMQTATDGGTDRFAGFPIYTHPGLPAIGASSKSGVFGDFQRGYWIRRVNGIFMQRQNELHSDNGQVGFRAYLRLDGKPVLTDAMRIIAFAAT